MSCPVTLCPLSLGMELGWLPATPGRDSSFPVPCDAEIMCVGTATFTQISLHFGLFETGFLCVTLTVLELYL